MNCRISKLLPCAFLSCFALLAGSCVKRPDGVLDDKEMAPVVADMQIAEAYIRNNPSRGYADSRLAMEESILRSHNMTRAEYDSTMRWYAANPDAYYEFCDHVASEIVRHKRRLAGIKGDIPESADLWPYGRMSVVMPTGSTEGLEFSVPTTEIEAGQRIRLRMRTLTPTKGTSLFGVEYDNGMKSYVTGNTSGRKIELEFQTDTAHTVSRVFGNISFDAEHRRNIWIDSISMTALPFDSMEYHRIHMQRIWREPKRRTYEMENDVSQAGNIKE